ncbi:MAG: glycosyltransferase family 39 protein, partial [Bacteroidota bacterium]
MKILACILAIHMLFWLALRPAVPSTDDLCYLKDAIKVSEGTYEFNSSPKTQRLGIILPTCLFVSAFGTSPYAVSLLPLIFSIATILFIYLHFKRDSSLALAISILIAVNTVQITYSCALFPDVVLSLFMFVIVFSFSKRDENRMFWGFFSAITLVVAFFVKQLVIVLIPLLSYWILRDLIKRRNTHFHKAFTLTFLIVGSAVIYTVYQTTGDALFLLKSVEENHNRVFADMPLGDLINRLTWQPFVFLNGLVGFWPLILLAIPAVIHEIKNRSIGLHTKYLLYLVCIFWFCSTSLENYSPILLLDRMWLPILIPLCILSAKTIVWQTDAHPSWVNVLTSATLILSAGLSFNRGNEGEGVFYLLIPLTLLLIRKSKTLTALPESAKALTGLVPFILLACWFVISNSNWIS